MMDKKESLIKALRLGLLCFFVLATAYPQTIDLGQSVFYNDEGDIIMAADAGLAVRKLDSPYVMFMAYMVARANQSLSVHRDDVTMVYNGQEYKMPSLKELREKYKGEMNDMNTYRRLGKEALIFSKMKFYNFPTDSDFFPVLGTRSALPVDEGSMANQIGFRTKFYFKNPGFKKGDQLVLKVHDRKNPELVGSVAVILQ